VGIKSSICAARKGRGKIAKAWSVLLSMTKRVLLL
jgi:hypothetical protein